VTSLIFPLFIAGALAFTLLRPDEAPPPTPPAPSAPEGLAGPPSARDFSNPREYASAVTLFSLTHGGAKVFGRPDCRDFATWTAWSCTMRAKLPGGPYAGRPVTYRCFPTWQGPADRSAVPIVICGPENPPRIPGVVPLTPVPRIRAPRHRDERRELGGTRRPWRRRALRQRIGAAARTPSTAPRSRFKVS
jgi:hypothetical protein